MEQPDISIIIPVYNGSKHINNLMNSLLLLDQPKGEYDIIIIDNGSNDGTVDLIRDFIKIHPQIKLYFEKIKSSYIARNTGIRNASGDIIAFTDSDCVVDKNWLTSIEKSFSENYVGCVAGEIMSGKWSSIIEEYYSKKNIMSQKITLNSEFLPYPMTANAAYRKDVFDKIGYFDEKLISGGDADIAWRMQLQTNYKILYDQKAVVVHRHRTNVKDMFKQQFSYGYGSTNLYKKYDNLMDYNVKNTLVDYLKLMLAIPLFGLRSFQRFFGLQEKYYLYEPLLAFLCISSFRLGRIYGSIKSKKLYL